MAKVPKDFNKNILITGATGFLGSYLLRHLINSGYQNISATKRSSSSMALVKEVKDQVNWIEQDILDLSELEETLKGRDWVFHCAAIVSFQPAARKKMFQVNVEGTANIVNFCLHHGVEKLLHVSSTAAIGRTKSGEVITEASKWSRSKHNTNYAISKYLAEQEVWRGMAEGLNVAIVNPSIILGSGFWDQGTQKLFSLTQGSYPFYPVGKNGFVGVRDVAIFILKLMESEIVNERFIVSSENQDYAKIFSMMAHYLGKKGPYIPVRPVLREIAWRIEWLKAKIGNVQPMVTKDTARTSSKSFLFDNTKSKTTLQFEYRPIEETIRETAQQFLKSYDQQLPAMYLPFH